MNQQTNPLVDKLFSVGAQYGYAKSRRHPSVASFMFGAKGGAELFDLERTATLMEGALAFIKERAARRETVLFVGSKAEARTTVERIAHRLNQPYVASRWIGGTLTNWSEIRKRLSRLTDLVSMREKGELAKFTKLERLLMEREENDLERMFGGLRGLEKMPAAIVVVDPRHEHIAVEEAARMHIPVVSLMNSDCDANTIAHPIPANDASRHTIEFVLEEIARAFEAGAAAPHPTVPVAAEEAK